MRYLVYRANIVFALVVLALSAVFYAPAVRTQFDLDEYGNEPVHGMFWERVGQPAEAALDVVGTILETLIFGYNAVKADQPKFVETTQATANVYHRLPPIFASRLGRSFISSGTIAKSAVIKPLKGETGYFNPDGSPELFEEKLDVDFDAGGGPDVDWVNLTLDGVPGKHIPRDAQRGYVRNRILDYLDVPIGKRRIVHWRASQQHGGKSVMTLFIEPTSLEDLFAITHLQENWAEMIEHHPSPTAKAEGRVPVVVQAFHLKGRQMVRVYDCEGYAPNQPRHLRATLYLEGFEGETVWVNGGGLVYLTTVQAGKVYTSPQPSVPTLHGHNGYDISGSSEARPYVVRVSSSTFGGR